MKGPLNKRVGLFFGSFNPIHVGHLIVARKALDDTEIDEIWFVVSPENPIKRNSGELEDANHRLKMVNKAIKGEPYFFSCDIEFELPTPSYTSTTLEKLRNKNPGTDFYIVTGTDTQLQVDNCWKNCDDILNNHKIIVYPRTLTEKDSKWKLTERTEKASIYLENVPQVDVSSTYIRGNIQNNKSIRFLVSDPVIEHIKNNNLYK